MLPPKFASEIEDWIRDREIPICEIAGRHNQHAETLRSWPQKDNSPRTFLEPAVETEVLS
jgi:hypothetical protein